MNVSLLSLFTGSSMQCEIAVSPTNGAKWRIGCGSGNESFLSNHTQPFYMYKQNLPYVKGEGDLFENSSEKYIVSLPH